MSVCAWFGKQRHRGVRLYIGFKLLLPGWECCQREDLERIGTMNRGDRDRFHEGLSMNASGT